VQGQPRALYDHAFYHRQHLSLILLCQDGVRVHDI
jgi:hypothetical protein